MLLALICIAASRPGNSCLRMINSAKMAPADQMSTLKKSKNGFCDPSSSYQLCAVVDQRKKELGRPVPAGGHILCHDGALLAGTLLHRAGQTKVGNFQQTIAIDQQIAGLQITVNNANGVQILAIKEIFDKYDVKNL
jgi:hypothetical protein